MSYKSVSSLLLVCGAAVLGLGRFSVKPAPRLDDLGGPFWVSSSSFKNNTVLPIVTINNIVSNSVNACSLNGATGGDQSPELSWGGAPENTRSYVVTLYDVTASFTHWGMYNIARTVTQLPQNAGILNSTYGQQIVNDFGAAAEYDGPCPPANVAPNVHHYVFTVYALDIDLSLPGTTKFPNNSETLYQALIEAGKQSHILAKASITGLYSTTPNQ